MKDLFLIMGRNSHDDGWQILACIEGLPREHVEQIAEGFDQTTIVAVGQVTDIHYIFKFEDDPS